MNALRYIATKQLSQSTVPKKFAIKKKKLDTLKTVNIFKSIMFIHLCCHYLVELSGTVYSKEHQGLCSVRANERLYMKKSREMQKQFSMWGSQAELAFVMLNVQYMANRWVMLRKHISHHGFFIIQKESDIKSKDLTISSSDCAMVALCYTAEIS